MNNGVLDKIEETPDFYRLTAVPLYPIVPSLTEKLWGGTRRFDDNIY